MVTPTPIRRYFVINSYDTDRSALSSIWIKFSAPNQAPETIQLLIWFCTKISYLKSVKKKSPLFALLFISCPDCQQFQWRLRKWKMPKIRNPSSPWIQSKLWFGTPMNIDELEHKIFRKDGNTSGDCSRGKFIFPCPQSSKYYWDYSKPPKI